MHFRSSETFRHVELAERTSVVSDRCGQFRSGLRSRHRENVRRSQISTFRQFSLSFNSLRAIIFRFSLHGGRARFSDAQSFLLSLVEFELQTIVRRFELRSFRSVVEQHFSL